MSTKRLVGLVLLAGGVITLGMAYQQSESFGDQTKHFFTGDYRNKTMGMIAVGGVAALAGVVSLATSRRTGG